MQNRVLKKWDDLIELSQQSLKENVLKEFVTKDFGYFLLEIHRKEIYRLYIKIESEEVDVNFDFKGVNIYKAFHPVYKSNYLVIENKIGKSPHIFKLFTVDLIEKVSNLSESKAGKIVEVIYDWQQFFKNKVPKRLSESAEKGLFGELLLIDELIECYQEEILLGWLGPEKSATDFLFKTIGVEVKTTEKVSQSSVTISNIEQLNNKVKERLYLKVYHLYKEGAGGQTLVDLIQSIEGKIKTIQGRIIFESKLAQIGYYSEHATLYQTKWGIRNESTYHVVDDFPRLTKDLVPIGIYNISYTVNLDNCAKYLTDNSIIYDILGEE